MAKDYYIDDKVNSLNFKASNTLNSLYDPAYVRGLRNGGQIKPTHYSLNYLYNSPSDKIPFTETLAKVGKTDLSVKYYSKNQLYDDVYNRTASYMQNYNGQGTFTWQTTGVRSDNMYIVNLNTFENTRYSTMAPNGRGEYNMVMGAIDPSAGSPIRLKAPAGFYGYIECLTKNNTIGRVDLASAPSDIQNTRSVNTASDTAIGRSQAFTFFSDIGSRQVSFSFDVYADYLPAPYLDVLSYCKALEQMNFPTYSSDFINSPLVRFTYGGLHITGIPTITCTFGNTIKKGIIDKATVSVSIIETEQIVSGRVIL